MVKVRKQEEEERGGGELSLFGFVTYIIFKEYIDRKYETVDRRITDVISDR